MPVLGSVSISTSAFAVAPLYLEIVNYDCEDC